jgi:proline iminopeptidase
MRAEVNGARIFFDVVGAKSVPDGPVMREKPTFIVMHGGPGLDHSSLRPAFDQYADVAQVVYIDHRGNGRSEREPEGSWNLAQWGDDVFELCRALEIEKPVVFGQSFGGMVAIAYATRHPEQPSKVVFSSTAAQGFAYIDRSIELFRQRGGDAIAEMARHALTIGYDSPEFALKWMLEAMPFYNTKARPDPEARTRAIIAPQVLMNFLGPGGEGLRFDLRADLARIQCPALVLGGEDDPITPIESQEDIANAIPKEFVRFERFPGCGHGAFRDDPRGYDVIREFIVA